MKFLSKNHMILQFLHLYLPAGFGFGVSALGFLVRISGLAFGISIEGFFVESRGFTSSVHPLDPDTNP